MHVRTVCRVEIDNPHRNGLISRWGTGRDWPAAEAEQGQRSGALADQGASYGWDFNGQLEYIEPLKAIGPVGLSQFTGLDIDEWTIVSGAWREDGVAGNMRAARLHFLDGSNGLIPAWNYGAIRSNANHAPNLQFEFMRYPRSNSETMPPVVTINLCGVGAEYAIWLPALSLGGEFWQQQQGSSGGRFTHPLLMGKADGTSQWCIIDELASGGIPQSISSGGETYAAQFVKVEYSYGALLINIGGTNKPWIFTGTWRDSNDREVLLELQSGPVVIEVGGHTASFTMEPLQYPTSCAMAPRIWHATSPAMVTPATDSAFRLTAHAPGSTGIAWIQDPASNEAMVRPRVAFTGDGTERALFFNLQEYRDAEILPGTSNPVTNIGNDALIIEEASGSCTSKWRGATLEIKARAKTGQTLPTFQPNGWIAAGVALQSTASPLYIQQFAGYIVPPEYEKAELGAVRANVSAADIVEARLKKKTMMNHCSYGGWPVDEAFRHILNRCGVPDSLIAIDGSISEASMGASYYLPVQYPGEDATLKFAENMAVDRALDTIMETRALEWGAGPMGQVFLRPKLEHTPGYYDWILDEDTATENDYVYSLRASRTLDDYVNVVHVIAGRGANATAKFLCDVASIATPGSVNFIGDDWWRVERHGDGDDPEEIAQKLWEKRRELARKIIWKTHSHPELMPDKFVRLEVSGVGVPVGTIVRIDRKQWQCGPELNTFEQTLEGTIVEEGSGV